MNFCRLLDPYLKKSTAGGNFYLLVIIIIIYFSHYNTINDWKSQNVMFRSVVTQTI